MKAKFRHPIAFLLFISAALLCTADAWALFSFTATPRRGGQTIRFEEAEPGGILRNEEVTLSVVSDLGKQYHIFQTVYQPLTNEFGNTLPQEALVVFSPSSGIGSIHTQLESPVTMGQMPIYTSDSAGTQDSFVLVFNVRVPADQPGGTYRTTLNLTAEPISPVAGVSPNVVILDVRLELRPTWKVRVENERGGRDLDLGKISKDRFAATGTLTLKIDSNVGVPYRLVQELAEPLTSADGSSLEENVLNFTVQAAEGNPSVSSREGLSPGPKIVYTSTDTGRGDTLQILFSAAPSIKQKAGIYTGMLHYRFESNSSLVSPEILSVPLRIEVEPIFYLNVKPQQSDGIHFGDFRDGKNKETSQMALDVQTNLGKPYQVSQIVSRKLTNETGDAMSGGSFLYSVRNPKTGTSEAPFPDAVKEGTALLFTSDNAGSAEEIIVDYELKIPTDAKGGNYSSDIKYSVTSL